MQPSVSKSFLEKMKLVRDDISLVWNDILERFQVIHRDKRTKHTRIVLTIEYDNGAFKHPDMRDILYLANVVAWDYLDIYPDPMEMGEKILRNKREKKIKADEVRKDYLRWFRKDNKKMFRKAMENLLKGISNIPSPEPRKIIV